MCISHKHLQMRKLRHLKTFPATWEIGRRAVKCEHKIKSRVSAFLRLVYLQFASLHTGLPPAPFLLVLSIYVRHLCLCAKFFLFPHTCSTHAFLLLALESLESDYNSLGQWKNGLMLSTCQHSPAARQPLADDGTTTNLKADRIISRTRG